MNEIRVDVSELEAPEPLSVILTEISLLEEGSYIKMIHRMEPCLLFDNLDKVGLLYKLYKKSDGGIELFIWHPQDSGRMKSCLPD